MQSSGDELVLYSSRLAIWLLVVPFQVLTLAFLYAGAGLPWEADLWPLLLLTGSGVVLFGGFSFLLVLMCIPAVSNLRLTPEGMTMRFGFWSTFYRWDQVQNFQVERRAVGHPTFPMDMSVVTFTVAPYFPADVAGPGLTKTMPDTYGQGANLAQLLNDWQKRHGPAVGERATS